MEPICYDPAKTGKPATKAELAEVAIHVQLIASSIKGALILLIDDVDAKISAQAHEEYLDLCEAIDGLQNCVKDLIGRE